MPLHSEKRSSGQVQRNAKIVQRLVLTMRKLKEAGYTHLSCEEICGTTINQFPEDRPQDLELNGGVELLYHTGLIALDRLDQSNVAFHLTQKGQDFDLEHAWCLILGDDTQLRF